MRAGRVSRGAELHRKIAAKRALLEVARQLRKRAKVFDDPRREGMILAAEYVEQKAESKVK